MLFSWRRFRERIASVLHLDEEPPRIAMGMATGVFIGVTPLYGLHTVLALLVASLFRLNKAATVTGAWFNLPWFAPFVYAFCHKLGQAVLLGEFSLAWFTPNAIAYTARAYLSASPAEHLGSFWRMLWDMMFAASPALFVGTTIVGLVVAVPTYFLTLQTVREIRRLRGRARPARKTADHPRAHGEPPP